MATKTNNDYLRDKIELRASMLPTGDIRVLDAFGGKGVVWRGVYQLTKRDIKVLPIDKADVGFRLAGDNTGWVKSINLSKFNVVDLDAYGVPYEQLKIIFEKKYKGIIFVTFIQSIYGQMPIGMLEDIGFTDTMVKKIPTLFSKRGWDYFLQWLAKNGVSEITHRSMGRKHYLGFNYAG